MLVIPAHAGIHFSPQALVDMDPRFRGDDEHSDYFAFPTTSFQFNSALKIMLNSPWFCHR